jgi:hypothetical protein
MKCLVIAGFILFSFISLYSQDKEINVVVIGAP